MQENTLVNRLIKWRNSQDKPLKEETDSGVELDVSDDDLTPYCVDLITKLIGENMTVVSGNVIYLIMEDFETYPNFPDGCDGVTIDRGIWEAYEFNYPTVYIYNVKYPQMIEIDKIKTEPLSYFEKGGVRQEVELKDFPYYLAGTFGWPEDAEIEEFLNELPE